MVRQSQVLVERLRARVRPARRGRRPVHHVVVLVKGHALALAVDLRAAGNQHRGPPEGTIGGAPQQGAGLLGVGLDAADRVCNHELDPDGRGHVVDLVELVASGLRPVEPFPKVGMHEGQTLVGIGQVRADAGREIVHDHHGIAAGQQPLDQMGTNKARAAGDQHPASVSRRVGSLVTQRRTSPEPREPRPASRPDSALGLRLGRVAVAGPEVVTKVSTARAAGRVDQHAQVAGGLLVELA